METTTSPNNENLSSFTHPHIVPIRSNTTDFLPGNTKAETLKNFAVALFQINIMNSHQSFQTSKKKKEHSTSDSVTEQHTGGEGF